MTRLNPTPAPSSPPPFPFPNFSYPPADPNVATPAEHVQQGAEDPMPSSSTSLAGSSLRPNPAHRTSGSTIAPAPEQLSNLRIPSASLGHAPSLSAPDLRTRSLDRNRASRSLHRRPKAMSYRSHFKQRYLVEQAWRNGGKCDQRQITPDQGVVTSLHLTDKYIVVALDNARIHVFDTQGAHQRTLQGHVMGVWAMIPWDDILVSGGCDRDVRVWNMATG